REPEGLIRASRDANGFRGTDPWLALGKCAGSVQDLGPRISLFGTIPFRAWLPVAPRCSSRCGHGAVRNVVCGGDPACLGVHDWLEDAIRHSIAIYLLYRY